MNVKKSTNVVQESRPGQECVLEWTKTVCVSALCRYELGFVVRVGGEKPYGSVLSLRREPQRWGRELVHHSGHLELYPSESTSPKMVFFPCLFFSFHLLLQYSPFLWIFLILITFIFLVGVWAWKKESKFFICHATLLGEKVTGREVKSAVGTASVCEMGVLYGTQDGSFFQSGKQTLETRGWNLW